MRPKHFYEFDKFRIDVNQRVLFLDGDPVALTLKAFEVLLVLVENSGRIVDKEELMRLVWPDTFVEEVNLARNVSDLRKALGDERSRPRFIETVPKRGYRFIGKVRALEDEDEFHEERSKVLQFASQSSAASDPRPQ